MVAVGTEQADGARGWHESEGDRRIGLLAGRIPRHIFLPDTRGIQRSHFSAPLYASYIRIYYPPNTYLHPANKLIHYSTEQSSSFLSLPSLFSRRRRRRRRHYHHHHYYRHHHRPFSFALFRECCQRFGKAPFTPCCRDDDTPRFTHPSPSLLTHGTGKPGN